MSKFIFVTGGVVSGLGKGITAASLGRLLKCRGLKVISQKLDLYMNVDPGTMSPFHHQLQKPLRAGKGSLYPGQRSYMDPASVMQFLIHGILKGVQVTQL